MNMMGIVNNFSKLWYSHGIQEIEVKKIAVLSTRPAVKSVPYQTIATDI